MSVGWAPLANSQAEPESPPMLISPSRAGCFGSGPISKQPIFRAPASP